MVPEIGNQKQEGALAPPRKRQQEVLAVARKANHPPYTTCGIAAENCLE